MGYDYGKIWVVGAYGRVGSTVRQMLDLRTAELLETDQDDVDITSAENVSRFAFLNRPNTILNCAAMTDMQACEDHVELAYKVNALGARNLSMAARKLDARIIQLSTDDIFDDHEKITHNEFDTPNPSSVYGKSKLAGENFVRELAPKHLIIRSSWVYGKGENFVNSILTQAKTQSSIEVAQDQYASPTSAKELTKVILRLIKKEQEGIYHVVCKGVCSRYELATEILRLTGQDHIRLIPKNVEEMPQRERQAQYTILDNFMLRICQIEEPVSWQEALAEYIKDLGKGGRRW